MWTSSSIDKNSTSWCLELHSLDPFTNTISWELIESLLFTQQNRLHPATFNWIILKRRVKGSYKKKKTESNQALLLGLLLVLLRFCWNIRGFTTSSNLKKKKFCR